MSHRVIVELYLLWRFRLIIMIPSVYLGKVKSVFGHIRGHDAQGSHAGEPQAELRFSKCCGSRWSGGRVIEGCCVPGNAIKRCDASVSVETGWWFMWSERSISNSTFHLQIKNERKFKWILVVWKMWVNIISACLFGPRARPLSHLPAYKTAGKA